MSPGLNVAWPQCRLASMSWPQCRWPQCRLASMSHSQKALWWCWVSVLAANGRKFPKVTCWPDSRLSWPHAWPDDICELAGRARDPLILNLHTVRYFPVKVRNVFLLLSTAIKKVHVNWNFLKPNYHDSLLGDMRRGCFTDKTSCLKQFFLSCQ